MVFTGSVSLFPLSLPRAQLRYNRHTCVPMHTANTQTDTSSLIASPPKRKSGGSPPLMMSPLIPLPPSPTPLKPKSHLADPSPGYSNPTHSSKHPNQPAPIASCTLPSSSQRSSASIYGTSPPLVSSRSSRTSSYHP